MPSGTLRASGGSLICEPEAMAEMLEKLEEAESLQRFLPLLDPDQAERRRIYITPDIKTRLDRLPGVRSHLKRFVIGARIDDDDFMSQLRPPEPDVWEFRIQLVPEHRVLGRFLLKDCFVALIVRDRQQFKVGKNKPRNHWWSKAIEEVGAEWSRLFGDTPWHSAESFSGYVTQPPRGPDETRY